MGDKFDRLRRRAQGISQGTGFFHGSAIETDPLNSCLCSLLFPCGWLTILTSVFKCTVTKFVQRKDDGKLFDLA